MFSFFFFFNDTATTEIYTLSLHDALPICAATPAPIVFSGSEGGTATTSVTFVTIGSQTLSARDAGTPQAAGAAAAKAHGLVYTGPNTGRVRLVANQTATNSNTVQLDLVANERLELSTFFGGGPGSFSAGMNLALDTTRVGRRAPSVP